MSLKRSIAVALGCVFLLGCSEDKPKTKLIYFGFDNRAESQADVIQLAKTWSASPPCQHWRATVERSEADYQVLFGDSDVTILDRRGAVVYSGGQGVLYAPNGNPDGTGTNICKLTGE
jgi:hypothetical protein